MNNEFENMSEILNTETKINNFVQTMQRINYELNSKGLYNVEYYLLMISTNISKDLSIKTYDELKTCILNYLNEYLLPNSETYNIIYNNSELLTLFTSYFSKLIEYYSKSYLMEQSRFNDYVSIEENKMSFNSKNVAPDQLGFSIDNIQNTMDLLNEALRLYYEVYNNRTLIATFSNEQEIKFRIKESELAHLLGLTLENIMSDKNGILADALHLSETEKRILSLRKELKKENNKKNDVKDMNKIKSLSSELYILDPYHEANISILHKFLDTKNGNLFEYEEDRIKKQLEKHEHGVINFPDKIQPSRFYSKANIKAKAFIKFKPLEELSMLLSLPDGYEFIKTKEINVKNGTTDSSQYDVFVSHSNLSDQYKYTTLLNNISKGDERRYFESLLIKSPSDIEDMQKIEKLKAAITTKVVSEPDEGSFGSTKEKIFSEEKQKEFIRQVFEDFKKVDFTELINYFKDLEQGCIMNSSINKRL